MLDALRRVSLFTDTPDTELQWLLDQGTEIQLYAGEQLFAEGKPATGWYVLLEGEVRITKKLADQGQEALLNRFQSGAFLGEVPILLGSPYLASAYALVPSRLLRLEQDCFWYMVTNCPATSQGVLKAMAERLQVVQSVSDQQHKLISLGTLAAGLAHELNNPAAALSRTARHLRELLQNLPALALQLQQQWNCTQLELLSHLQHQALQQATTAPALDSLVQCDLEDGISDWLEAHDIANAWQLAPTLVGAGLTTEWLDTVVAQVGADCLNEGLIWLDALLTGVGLLAELKQASSRIASLVQAIQANSALEQAPLQAVDVHEGLESSLTILRHKLKAGVLIKREYGPTLPLIWAYSNELNQVWTNLIDNAIDAVSPQGQIWVRTSCEHDQILVEIADNGPGMTPEIQQRIFEPFFTTKGVGEGTGLGLDSTYRTVVGRHQGDIQVFSQPGDTRFQVRLPICPSTPPTWPVSEPVLTEA
ncbi:ATP-binding protein [Leptolyngbya sp. FACHB-261]|uniref:ATP-binding protein n=1 Tax=Leptolyngbya sp. FACHB-261 TaxID=2692806 RepID=UPI001682CEDB|nr:ATP-binding protein [Leptolyngbya sp. FACHB-261]MBD2103019.1 cyclic nucleotide-binding domain-containing protein [Leptolyngbya sp. FACHB-261]